MAPPFRISRWALSVSVTVAVSERRFSGYGGRRLHQLDVLIFLSLLTSHWICAVGCCF